MPFRKQPDGTYLSPTGKVWTKKQIAAYHAGQFDHPPKKKSPPSGPQKRTVGRSND